MEGLAMATTLATAGRAPEIPESADAYGWLVGSWELDVFHYHGITPDAFHWLGESLKADGEHWRLEGESRARRMR
jgi:hypothetical protein